MFGFFNVNKPAGPTSHDLVAAMRRRLGQGIKVGHAGTLDPFASGVLVICAGQATKLADYIQGQTKRYTAQITLGRASTTDDIEGVITDTPPADIPTDADIISTIARFVGKISQVPPAHSAVHVNGKRAYKLARSGKEVEIPSRPVTIGEINLIRYVYPLLEIDVQCGSGTYIRSLARDIGKALGPNGYCSQLRRDAIGEFKIDNVKTVDELDLTADLLDPLLALVDFAKISLSTGELTLIRTGRAVKLKKPIADKQVAVLDEKMSLAALADVESGTILKPRKVFLTG